MPTPKGRAKIGGLRPYVERGTKMRYVKDTFGNVYEVLSRDGNRVTLQDVISKNNYTAYGYEVEPAELEELTR